MSRAVHGVGRVLRRGAAELGRARANRGIVPARRQVALWRKGFYAASAQLYDLDGCSAADYVSDLERAVRLGRLNAYPHVLDDKLVFALYLRRFGAPTPAVHAVVHDGVVTPLATGLGDDLRTLVRAAGRVVVKPRLGSGGQGVDVLTWDGSAVRATGASTPEAAVRSGRLLVTEHVEQHPYARALHPGSANTVRLLMLRDPASGEPFVTAAVQRIGTRPSGCVDNWGRGGLSAAVDVGTGVLGPAVAKPAPGEPLVWHDCHPETGARITGVSVPHWQRVVAEVERLGRLLPGARYVGWDVVVTADGFTVLEANNRSDVNLFQVHSPLLADDRARRFARAAGLRR